MQGNIPVKHVATRMLLTSPAVSSDLHRPFMAQITVNILQSFGLESRWSILQPQRRDAALAAKYKPE